MLASLVKLILLNIYDNSVTVLCQFQRHFKTDLKYEKDGTLLL